VAEGVPVPAGDLLAHGIDLAWMEHASFALAGIGLLFVAFLWWRYTSVGRGARKRDAHIRRVLDPVAHKLRANEPGTAAEIEALARRPEVRLMLYHMLEHFQRLDLFPESYLSLPSQGEALLAHWLMHPNELQEAPEEIELVETIVQERGGEQGVFLVYRYRMPDGHWAAKEGWLLGLAGPFPDSDEPYMGVAGAFSRCTDKYGAITPAALVDWYVDLLIRKGF
jgi:hypothetical protein